MNKLLYLLLLFTSIVYSQDSIPTTVSNYSIIKNIKNPDIVYRGINNPITIHVPKAKSFTAIGEGLKKESNNIYSIYPGQGKEVEIKLEITLENDSIVKESQFFKINELPILMGYINGQNCKSCIVELTKKELKDATITLGFPNTFLNYTFNVKGFTIVFTKRNKKPLHVSGNIIDSSTYKVIEKLKKGEIFYILRFKFSSNLNNLIICKTSWIQIKIID